MRQPTPHLIISTSLHSSSDHTASPPHHTITRPSLSTSRQICHLLLCLDATKSSLCERIRRTAEHSSARGAPTSRVARWRQFSHPPSIPSPSVLSISPSTISSTFGIGTVSGCAWGIRLSAPRPRHYASLRFRQPRSRDHDLGFVNDKRQPAGGGSARVAKLHRADPQPDLHERDRVECMRTTCSVRSQDHGDRLSMSLSPLSPAPPRNQSTGIST